jgi:hypothetical protein
MTTFEGGEQLIGGRGGSADGIGEGGGVIQCHSFGL